MEGGAIRNQHGTPIPFPDERQFFEWCGLPYWPPSERSEYRIVQFLDSHFFHAQGV
jgi:hypothetical protein